MKQSYHCQSAVVSSTLNKSWAQLKLDFAPEYGSYSNMMTRCYNENHDYWDSYGGKGIKVFTGWMPRGKVGFVQFLSDMGQRPEGHTLERKDLSKDYTPDNCIWETDSNQQFNKGLYVNSKSGITGVTWHNRNQCWTVQINKNKKRSYLGSTKDFFEACCIRKKAELEFFPDKEKTY